MMSIQEFVKRQNEYIGKTAEFAIRWNDGDFTRVERAITRPDEYHMPNSEAFEITEVTIKEVIQ